jgi:hypothetical protein
MTSYRERTHDDRAENVPEFELANRGGMPWLTARKDPGDVPENHSRFLCGEYGQTGDPEAFAVTLRDIIAGR